MQLATSDHVLSFDVDFEILCEFYVKMGPFIHCPKTTEGSGKVDNPYGFTIEELEELREMLCQNPGRFQGSNALFPVSCFFGPLTHLINVLSP